MGKAAHWIKNYDLNKITEKDIDLYQILCKYIGNKITEKSNKSFLIV